MMRVWKQCTAALLALIMVLTCAPLGYAAGTVNAETSVWSATAADIVLERYGLADNKSVAAIFANEAVNAGAEYTAEIPHANGTEGKKDLVVVDYHNKVVYVDSYESQGLVWIPTEAVVLAEGAVQETYTLSESVSFYNNEAYFAEQAFSYDGKSYTVEVMYELSVSIDLEEQQRILDAPAHLRQGVKNVNTTLAGMRSNLALFGQEIPTLHKMLTMSLPADGEKEAEPFFDEEKHAAEIETIIALFAEYTRNAEEPQLDMFTVALDRWNSELDDLSYAMASGATVRDTAIALYEKLQVLQESQRLRSLLTQLKKIDIEVHTSLKSLYRYMDRLMNPLEVLQSEESWTILDPAVQASIFKTDYDPAELDALGSIASSLRSYLTPMAEEATIVAAKMPVACEIVTYDVTVTMDAFVVDDGVGNAALKQLESRAETIRVLEGVTQEELDAVIASLGLEENALAYWNGLSDAYKISTGNYRRTQTAIKGALQSDLDYAICYEPNSYKVKSNYGVNLTVPFGYLLELPECVDGDGWYDYRVNSPAGENTYNQGSVLAVESDLEITRVLGTAKFEYRILDFLAEDPQYAMSDLAKNVLLNSALISPTVRIRLPGENIGSVVETGTGFYIEANSMASGMRGMSWEIDAARLYDEDVFLQDLSVKGARVSWETAGFTHVIFDHSMQITRVRDGIGSRELTASEINGYANLPATLSVEVGNQNRALGGSGSASAKTILEKMAPYESVLGLMKEEEEDIIDILNTTEAKNAVLRLIGSESAAVKGFKGATFPYGGWSDYAKTPALFYYLRQCESAGWSLATYYQQKYYVELEKQAMLMAECLEAIVDDSGFVTAMDSIGNADAVQKLKNVIPDLVEMSRNMKGPDVEHMDIYHTQFPTLIANLLAAEGKVKEYPDASGLYAYETIRRNGKNFGVLQVTVQKGDIQRSMTIDYKMDVVDGSERYYIVKENDERFITGVRTFVAEAEAALSLDAEEKLYHNLYMSGAFPQEGEHLKGDILISLLYTPKTYTVTVKDGAKETILETFTYSGKETESYPVNLPARSQNPKDTTYYEYTFKDVMGSDGKPLWGYDDVVASENGSVGHFAFKREWLPQMFPNGSYTISRRECKEKGEPVATLVPTLSKEWIRGYVDASNNKDAKRFYMDVNPYKGLTYDQFLEQVALVQENGKNVVFEILNLEGDLLLGGQPIGTGMTINHKMKNVFGQEVEGNLDGCVFIMMGDVNGDGLCDDDDDTDVRKIAGAYFLEVSAETDYMALLRDELGLSEAEALAANMNNNRKIDSNDAWTIRSKGLYWDGRWTQSQIIYRSVLRR